VFVQHPGEMRRAAMDTLSHTPTHVPKRTRISDIAIFVGTFFLSTDGKGYTEFAFSDYQNALLCKLWTERIQMFLFSVENGVM